MKKKDLKCCGNCHWLRNIDSCTKIKDRTLKVNPFEVCKCWQFDELKKTSRLVEKFTIEKA